MTMHRRINITRPEPTIRLIDRVADKGDRSRFIDTAVRRYLDEVGCARLRKQLKAGLVRDAGGDRQVAAEWFSIDEEAWQNSDRSSIPDVVRFTVR